VGVARIMEERMNSKLIVLVFGVPLEMGTSDSTRSSRHKNIHSELEEAGPKLFADVDKDASRRTNFSESCTQIPSDLYSF
jgi:hypothetical protein